MPPAPSRPCHPVAPLWFLLTREALPWSCNPEIKFHHISAPSQTSWCFQGSQRKLGQRPTARSKHIWKLVASPSTGIRFILLPAQSPRVEGRGFQVGTLALHTGCPESRLGAQDSPGRPLVWPRGQGATPPHRQGWSRTPARGPRTQRPPAPPEPRFFDAAGLGPRDGRSEVVVPERGVGTSLRPCSSRSPAPPLGGRLRAPFSFLLCKSPSFLISCFVPGCNRTCCYVTSIIKIPPSQGHCALHEAGEKLYLSFFCQGEPNPIIPELESQILLGAGACSHSWAISSNDPALRSFKAGSLVDLLMYRMIKHIDGKQIFFFL